MSGDRGLFDDSSMLRRVHREQLIALAGPRALLLMAAHPVAFEGFFDHTGALGDPYARLQRTALVLEAITYGSAARARELTARVRAVHRTVRGTLDRPAGRFPAGTPYAADDPALLLWILACLVDSNLTVYERYLGSLSHAEQDAYWRDMRVVGRLFGLRAREMPAGVDGFRDYMGTMLDGDELLVTERARALGIRIVMRPPVPPLHRPLLEMANFITVGLLPPRIRRGYGLHWDPARTLMLAGGAEYTKRVILPLLPSRLRYARRPAA